ncbi:MAG: SEC-C metal-binding domain-containing protein [Candidatus Omnitrophota bacterium]
MKDKIPDRRAMEKTTSDLSRLLEGQHFESQKELKDYLNGIVRKGKIPKAPPRTAINFAQDIMYEAWEAESKSDRIRLAHEALLISPDCADAYNLLAEEDAGSLAKLKELYEKGVDAGRRALGEEMFQEGGGFWGYLPTRPYMRARAGLMQCLWELEEYDEAIVHAKEMLCLNTNDNQGIRYVLVRYLLELRKYDELKELLSREAYEDDCGVEWLYAKPLLSFMECGDSDKARKELKDAIAINSHVPMYIMGRKLIPQSIPDRCIVGSEEEAMAYAADFILSWRRVQGAVEWLQEQSGIKVYSKVGRNEPCPCGSGKKFKKCCGA